MPILTYLPTKLNSELARFKTTSGNTKIDYRDVAGPAPSLLETPMTLSVPDFVVDVLPALVPTDPHVTGDISNYRRYSSDVAVVTDDYQRNVVMLNLPGQIIRVTYLETKYKEDAVDLETIRSLDHYYTLDEDFVWPDYLTLQHLILDAQEVERGFVDTKKVVEFKLDTSMVNTSVSYFPAFELEEQKIVISETVLTDYGNDGDVIAPALVPDKVKLLQYVIGRLQDDDSYNTNILYGTPFTKTGDVLSTTNTTPLNATNPNLYLHSKSLSAPQDVLGYGFSTNPISGSLLHVVSASDNTLHTDHNEGDLIGSGSIYFGTEYLGLLSSPFLLLNFNMPAVADTFTLKIGSAAPVTVGDYSASTFNHLCAKLSELLYGSGILVVPCKNNTVAFDRFLGTGDIELVLTSTETEITTLPLFASFEYLHSTESVVYDNALHPTNYSLSYIDDTADTVDYLLTYKLKISQDSGRNTDYVNYRVRLDFDVNSVRNTTQSFKLDVEEGTLDTTFTISNVATINSVLDEIVISLDAFLSTNYTVEVNYLTGSIDIVNNLTTTSAFIKITAGEWVTFSPRFGGSYLQNADTSETSILKPNDSSIVMITDHGSVCFNTLASDFKGFGMSTLNPVTGQFSTLSGLKYTNTNSYCYSIQEYNNIFREYGYEVVPLFDGGTGDANSLLGVTRISASASQVKPVIIVDNKTAAITNGTYKASKTEYHITTDAGVRTELLLDNASLLDWKSKTIPGMSQYEGAPLHITENFTSLYKKIVTGQLANSDNITASSLRAIGTGVTQDYTSVVINALTDPEKTCGDLYKLLLCPTGTPSLTYSVVGDIHTVENAEAKVDYDSVTRNFTLTIKVKMSRCTSLGFSNAADIVINDYAGWVKQPIGYNAQFAAYSTLEANAQVYMMIVSYDPTVDGA